MCEHISIKGCLVKFLRKQFFALLLGAATVCAQEYWSQDSWIIDIRDPNPSLSLSLQRADDQTSDAWRYAVAASSAFCVVGCCVYSNAQTSQAINLPMCLNGISHSTAAITCAKDLISWLFCGAGLVFVQKACHDCARHQHDE